MSAVGALVVGNGVYKIIGLGGEVSDPDSLASGIDVTAKEKIVYLVYPAGQSGHLIGDTFMTLTAQDIFAVDNPFHATFATSAIEDPDNIKEITFYLVDPGYDYSWLNYDNYDEFAGSHHSAIPLLRSGTDSFASSVDLTFPVEGDFAFFGVVLTNDHQLFRIEDSDKAITISPAYAKLQFDTNRVTVEKIQQGAETDKIQRRTNDIIEGLSWILVGWIPFQIVLRFWTGDAEEMLKG
jgi:hypothetical protein